MKFLVSNIFFFITTTIVIFVIVSGFYTGFIFYVAMIISWLGFLYCAYSYYKNSERLINPTTCFCLSVFVFLVSRPFLSLLMGDEVISIGLGITEENIIKATLFVMWSFYLINIFYCFFDKPAKFILNGMPDIKIKSYTWSNVFLLFSLFLSFLFLKNSYFNYNVLSNNENYFSFISSLDFSYFRYFFISKYFLILYIVLSKSNKSLLISTSILFLSSLGFMAIGLRGYTIAYLFLFLLAYDVKYKIKLIPLIVLSLSLIILSASVLSFRLGFDVFENDSYLSIILKTIAQQGATFEVVFGAVNFLDEINKCISYYDYFIQGIPFGDCVDVSRGVYFAEGGFASSFFAELVFFWPILILIIPLFSFCLKLLSLSYDQILSSGSEKKSSILLVFFLLPNLVYFARSSVFDFIEKTIISIFFILFISLVIKIIRKKDA
ncbi:O-antigen polysaccharide polymerase Wzy family protein [Vibrio pomeroyi]|uniref:O-antigen polysaccharide polymerase Wzy family protein n=1 Tax=Vibrio pomeroyi TaxID=198832 RepID=UPI0021C2C406|nr:O-antigen polysaccharide polymerase Wzy family protein [Vibrio pomeroyi]